MCNIRIFKAVFMSIELRKKVFLERHFYGIILKVQVPQENLQVIS